MTEQPTLDAVAIQQRLEKISQQFIRAKADLEALWQQVKALPDDGQGKRDTTASSLLQTISSDGYVAMARDYISTASAHLNAYAWLIEHKGE